MKFLEECLKKHKNKKLTATQIAEWIFKNYPKACLQKKRKSQRLETNNDLIRQMAAEVGAYYHSGCTWLKRIQNQKPYRYYYFESSRIKVNATRKIKSTTSEINTNEFKEKELYQKLITYLEEKHGLKAMRIDEKKSSKKRKKRKLLVISRYSRL